MKKYSSIRIGAANAIKSNLKKFRLKLGFNQENFALKVGLTKERIIELENGVDALRSCVEILEIAEKIGVGYADFFEKDNEKHTRVNAHVGVEVMRLIDERRIDNGISVKDFCEVTGCKPTNYYRIVRGDNDPAPFSFQNMLTLLNLSSLDLKRVHVPEREEEQKPLPEPKPELVESEDSCKKELNNIAEKLEPKTEEQPQPDEFETRMLKVMRLQKDIDSLMNQTKAIMSIAYDLYKALEKLK